MRKTIWMAAWLLVMLAGCEQPQEPAASGGGKTVSEMPEHFDRMRAEQVEKEEDRLYRKTHRN